MYSSAFAGAAARHSILALVVSAALALPHAAQAQLNGFTFQGARYASGVNPAHVAIADLNGDSAPDLVVADYGLASNTVSVYLRNPNGGYAPRVAYAAGTNPVSVAVGDLNGDGRPDIVVSNWGSGDVSVLLAQGAAGTFAPQVTYAVGGRPISGRLADVTGDGILDLIVADWSGGRLCMHPGVGNGTFGTQAAINVGSGAYWLDLGDLDHDGDLDAVVALRVANQFAVATGDGSGAFTLGPTYATPAGPISIALADFNGNGDLDVVTASLDAQVLSYRAGDGLAGFGARTDFGSGITPLSVVAADFDGDAKPDLAVSDYTANLVRLFAGNGAGGFTLTNSLAAASGPSRLGTGDVDSDGDVDIAAPLANSDSVAVYSNQTLASQVPSPEMSTCPLKVTLAPDGSCCFDVVVRSLAANPIPGSNVVIDFGGCPTTFCPTQPPNISVNLASNTASATTDASGTARFCLCVDVDPGCTVNIYADGVLLCSNLPVGACSSDCVTVDCPNARPQWNAPGFAGFGGKIAIQTTEALGEMDYCVTAFDLTANVPGIGVNWAGMSRFNGPIDGSGFGLWRGEVLGSVFGLTLDDAGNVYVCQTSCYQNDLMATVAGATWGSVYKIDAVTGVPTTFASLPNATDPTATVGQNHPALGNITFDRTHHQLYVSDIEDGKIYALDMSGNVVSTFDHGVADNGAPGFAPLGELVWAVQYQDGRVYYSVWRSHSNTPGVGPNEIWSVAVDANGDFLPATDRKEIQVPGYQSASWSNPVSDMSFLPGGELMLAERSMSNVSMSYAHNARLLKYRCEGGVWSNAGQNFTVGVFAGSNSAGGVSVDHEPHAGGVAGRVWVTGDAIQFNSNNYIYGLQGLPPTGGSGSTSYLIDSDGIVSSSDKFHQGDVEIPCEAAPTGACPDSSILELRFDDGGQLGKDTSGHGHHGVVLAAQAALGNCGNALSFQPDNNVHEFEVPHASELDVTGAMSAAAWVRVLGPQSTDNNPSCTEGTIFCKGGANWFQIEKNNDRILLQNEPSGNEIAYADVTIPVGVWTLVGYVRGPWNGTSQSIQFYVNGQPVTTVVKDNNVVVNGMHYQAYANNHALMVGNYGFQDAPGACEFNGEMDDIRIWNTALTPGDMLAMMTCPCPDSSQCSPEDHLTINTGWNQIANATLATGTADNEWVVVADPDPGTNEPRPAFVISGISAWAAPQANSRWISAYPAAAHETNGHYQLEYRFCLEDTLGAWLETLVRADDGATLYLNGTWLGATGYYGFGSNTAPIAIGTTNSSLFRAGDNVLRVDLENKYNVAMGLNLVGTVHGNTPLYHYCCTDSSAAILGTKWNDLNRDGIWQAGEPAMSGWTITLSNGRTAVTDKWGDYAFMGLVPGTYTVTEENRVGWTRTAPATTGYTVILGKGQVAQDRNFGNAQFAQPAGSLHGRDWLHDAFTFNETPGLPGTAPFDTTTALVVTGRNTAQLTGNPLRFDIPGDSLVACACGDSTRLDLVFRILPGPGNFRTASPRSYPFVPGMQLLQVPTNQSAVVSPGDASFWGQYLADNGLFGSPGGHPGGVWSENVWNSARMDTAEFNIFPVSRLGDLPMISSCVWSGTYHESDPKYTTLGIPKFLCFVVDTLQPATSSPSFNNVLCNGVVPVYLTTLPPSYSGWNGVNFTLEHTKIIPDGLLTPGSHVEYFLRRSHLADPAVFTMVPDTTKVWPQYDEFAGADTNCTGRGGSSFDGHRWQQFGVLPDRWKDVAFGGQGMACMLYADQADGHGDERVWVSVAEMIGATNAFKRGSHNGWSSMSLEADPNDPAKFVRTHRGQAGTTWDLYSVQATDDLQFGFAGSLGGRLANRSAMGFAAGKYARIAPTPEMLRRYYQQVYLTSADQQAGILGPLNDRSQDEMALLDDFLTTIPGRTMPRGLHVTGSGFVQSETASGLPAHLSFLSNRLGLTLRDPSYRTWNSAACADLPTTNFLAPGSSVFGVRNDATTSNDVLQVVVTGSTMAAAYYENVGGSGPYVASVGRLPTPSENWIALTDGFALQSLANRYCVDHSGQRNFLYQVYTGIFGGFCPIVGAPVGTTDVPEAPRLQDGLLVRNNPAPRGRVGVRLTLAKPDLAEVAIYDLAGRRVRTLVSGVLTAGIHDLTWNGAGEDGSRQAAGVYFVRARLKGSGFTQSRTLVLVE